MTFVGILSPVHRTAAGIVEQKHNADVLGCILACDVTRDHRRGTRYTPSLLGGNWRSGSNL